MKLGFIGLGIMGGNMAANLARKGHTLSVFNRDRAKAEALVRDGAISASGVAQSPADAATGVDIVFTMLADPGAVHQMALGPNGFLPAMQPGALWVDCSTCNPTFAIQMARQAAAHGVRYLEAPVAGTRQPAMRGELTFLVGGAEADVEACRPLLECMGTRITHAGEHGRGNAMKLVLNLLLAASMAAFAEALAFGESMGLSTEQLLQTLINGPLVAPFIGAKVAKITTGDYATDFPLRWMHKDLHMASEAAFEYGAALPIGGAVKELYSMAKRAGLGDQDFSAITAFIGDQHPNI